jgi:hypothetical protein
MRQFRRRVGADVVVCVCVIAEKFKVCGNHGQNAGRNGGTKSAWTILKLTGKGQHDSFETVRPKKKTEDEACGRFDRTNTTIMTSSTAEMVGPDPEIDRKGPARPLRDRQVKNKTEDEAMHELLGYCRAKIMHV